MVLQIFTDGGSRGNPGPASIGMVFYADNKKVFTYREDIGIATNNEAEYSAVITAISKIKNQKSKFPNISKIEFYSDSQLLVNQLNGLYKVKNAKIREFVMKIRILEQEINSPITYHHILREENTEADALVNNKVYKV